MADYVTGTDWKLKKSAAHPTNDTDAAGGAKSATLITNAVVGEFLTRLVALTSGDLGVDVVKQYQKAFWDQTHPSAAAGNCWIYLRNGLLVPAAAGQLKFQSSSALDGATVKVKSWHVLDGGTTIAEAETILNGTTQVNGPTNVGRVIRAQTRLVSNSAQTPAAGNITLTVGAEEIGMIPATWSWATDELQIGVVATTDDSGTSTNRRTAPAGIAFHRATKLSNARAFREDSGNNGAIAGVAQGFWIEQTLEPGMPPMDGVDFVPYVEWESL